MKQTVILFDINETVLNLNELRPKFKSLLGDEKYTDTWFSMLLHTSTVSLITETKTNFGTLSKITLDSLATKLGVQLSPQNLTDFLSIFASLAAHDDIKPSLTKLKKAGFKTVAFSNSSKELIHNQISNAGLSPFFDEIISVEEANTFKPSAKAYHYAAEKLKCSVNNLRLVATHDWDTHGAMSAGLKAAYINRFNTVYNPLYQVPDINEPTMHAIVEKIITIDP